jgi:hypothetical protein
MPHRVSGAFERGLARTSCGLLKVCYAFEECPLKQYSTLYLANSLQRGINKENNYTDVCVDLCIVVVVDDAGIWCGCNPMNRMKFSFYCLIGRPMRIFYQTAEVLCMPLFSRIELALLGSD